MRVIETCVEVLMCVLIAVFSAYLWIGSNSCISLVYSILFFCCGLLPCRRQFDLANREAMDESAEWRRRFDSEHEKSAKCSRELNEVRSFV